MNTPEIIVQVNVLSYAVGVEVSRRCLMVVMRIVIKTQTVNKIPLRKFLPMSHNKILSQVMPHQNYEIWNFLHLCRCAHPN